MPHFSLAGADWLAAHAQAADTVILDTRPAALYWAGHLRGSRHLDAALLTLPRTDAAAIARFQALLGFVLSALGVQAHSRVLVVGAAGEVNVSRAAWALAYAGVEHIALLDGGLAALPRVELETTATPVLPTRFDLQPVSRLLATLEEVKTAAAGTALIDARERDEFLGLRSNASRHGRIPGALHWDTRAEVDAAGRLQPVPALAALGDPAPRRIAYCGGGGRAARSFVALQLAGVGNSAVYPGSWNEWGHQETLPVETGEPSTVHA